MDSKKTLDRLSKSATLVRLPFINILYIPLKRCGVMDVEELIALVGVVVIERFGRSF